MVACWGAICFGLRANELELVGLLRRRFQLEMARFGSESSGATDVLHDSSARFNDELLQVVFVARA